MRRPDRALVALLLAALGLAAAAADEPLLRHRAGIVVERNAAFVQLPLNVAAYAKVMQPDLADLRVVDARGDNVPFALLAPRPDEAQRSEALRGVSLYALPPRPAAGTAWASPLELTVEGERISVKRRAGAPAAAARPPGWLVDLGEPQRDEPAAQALHLQWDGAAEFSVGYRLEQSEDLRQWRPAGSGQLLALASEGGALTQPRVPLPAAPARFVRLVWDDAEAAPALTGASTVRVQQRQVTLDEPTELHLSPSPQPPGGAPEAAPPPRAVHFDLGAVLPLVQLDLQLPPGTQVAPVRLQGRRSVDEPWQSLAGAVFYRIEREGDTRRSPPLVLQRSVRFIRVLPDPRATALDAAQLQLIVRVQLASLVFAVQGQPPYALLAGSAQARTGALPLATLVPALAEERPRFGRATLGDWGELEAALQQARDAQRSALLRRGTLWAVLLGGVALLGAMVWRLARGGPRSVQ